MENFNEFNKVANPEKETGSILSHAFENYKKVILYGILLFVGVAVASSFISFLLELILGIDSQDPELMQEVIKNRDFSLLIGSPGFISNTSSSFIIGLLFYPLYAGFLYIIHKANNNLEFNFNDLFIGYRQNTLNIILYGLLSSILIGIGFVLCIIPGFFALALTFIGLPIVFFENKSPVEALQKAFEVSKEHVWTMVAVSLLAILISISGVFLCFVGIVFTAMFSYSAMYSSYSALCGTPYEVKTE